jgi:hypothetical protein
MGVTFRDRWAASSRVTLAVAAASDVEVFDRSAFSWPVLLFGAELDFCSMRTLLMDGAASARVLAARETTLSVLRATGAGSSAVSPVGFAGDCDVC